MDITQSWTSSLQTLASIISNFRVIDFLWNVYLTLEFELNINEYHTWISWISYNGLRHSETQLKSSQTLDSISQKIEELITKKFNQMVENLLPALIESILCELLSSSRLACNSEKSTIKISNYSILRTDRPAGKHGGDVCILIHKSIRFNREFIESGKELEYVLIKIKNLPKKNESLRIISYYSPPGLVISNQFLNKAFASYKNLIVLGDLNAHHPSWHSSSKNQSGIRLDELLGKLDCTNLN